MEESTVKPASAILPSGREFRLGWKPDCIDTRDQLFTPFRGLIPDTLDLRTRFTQPEIYDQGSLGSCTANAIGFAYQFRSMVQNNRLQFAPSRLFIYYNERASEGTIAEDSGAQIRTGIKSVNREGVCSELTWPYRINAFKTRPPPRCYSEAVSRKSRTYKRVDGTIAGIKSAIASGHPVVFGFYVYSSFTTIDADGVMPMPKPDEEFLGGHAVVAVGYTRTHLIVRNSWGSKWGADGYFVMPFEFITPDRTADFWIITQITNPLSWSFTPQPPLKRRRFENVSKLAINIVNGNQNAK